METVLLKCLHDRACVAEGLEAEGAGEKHLPAVSQCGEKICVQVGSIEHPMTKEHNISWIYLETKKGGQFVYLKDTDKPRAEFVVAEGDKATAAYAYCNQHGFWKTVIE